MEELDNIDSFRLSQTLPDVLVRADGGRLLVRARRGSILCRGSSSKYLALKRIAQSNPRDQGCDKEAGELHLEGRTSLESEVPAETIVIRLFVGRESFLYFSHS